MINVNGIKRNAKNIVKKYSDAEIKVREATSNDPWGPSSTIMAEIADLTYNVVAFSEIMKMIWKRLNDHGKNWRHVYKALVVLEYLIKTGSEKVAQQCIENIFAIKTLKDFQYLEENKDHGMNIREKSKKLADLLNDPEKLKAERARAIKAKSRLAESISFLGKSSSGSEDTVTNNDSGSSSSGLSHLPDVGSLSILNSAAPQTATDEENQLKLALALSKEEAEQQEKTRRNDELRLRLALDVSKKCVSGASLLDDLSSSTELQSQPPAPVAAAPFSNPSKSTIDDLLGLTIAPPEPQNDPWSVDPWQSISTQATTQAPVTTTTTFPPSSNQSQFSPTPSPLSLATPATTISVPNPLIASDNIFGNKRAMSKNPFED